MVLGDFGCVELIEGLGQLQEHDFIRGVYFRKLFQSYGKQHWKLTDS